MKTFDAYIVCCECQSQPFPDPGSGFRETFDLMRVGDAWFCERHRPAGHKRAARLVATTPLGALSEFERLFQAENARFEEALTDGGDDLLAEFEAYSGEVARALTGLRKVLTPQKPPASRDDLPMSRAPKKIKPNERLGEGQKDWVADNC